MSQSDEQHDDADARRETSTSLVDRLRLRDATAWVRLNDLYGPLVYHWGRSRELSDQDATDLVQEVLQRAWTGMDRFRHDQPEHTFRGWLFTIAKNCFADQHRGHAQEPTAKGGTEARVELEQIAGAEPPTGETSIHDSGGHESLLQRTLDTVRLDFSQNVWQAFLLTALADNDSADVAKQLGMTPGAVRQAKYRVLTRMREELGDA